MRENENKMINASWTELDPSKQSNGLQSKGELFQLSQSCLFLSRHKCSDLLVLARICDVLITSSQMRTDDTCLLSYQMIESSE